MNQISYLRLLVHAILNSYGQVFFSKSLRLGGLLLFVSFFHPSAGLGGLLAVITVALAALLFSFDQERIASGVYSFNSLLVGLGLGYTFEFSLSFVWVSVIISLLTFFTTLWFAKILGDRGLPFLSIPFLVGIWIALSAAEHFSGMNMISSVPEKTFGPFSGVLSYTTALIAELPFPNVILLYLRSVGAILFQFSDLAGLLISIGLFFYSRMAWLASVLGFGIGYFFFQFMEGDFSTLVYTYVGFNFILTAMAIATFFLVPTRKSFAVLLLMIPLTAIVIAALHSLFQFFQLPIYSLPFNLLVILFLMALYQRRKANGLHVVSIQHYFPEKNHYYFFNDQERFRYNTYVHIALPVIGEWRVSQGYHGNITHKGEWAQALDFDMVDAEGKTYKQSGYQNEDYYCYGLPITAPAAGTVEAVVDHIPDNEVGAVNLQENWGNTIVIKHGDYLYSKISHLKAGSITVEVGEVVQRGQILARLGSSGRSPEAHLHFQLQTTPYVGSKTIHFPISHYLVKQNGQYVFRAFSVPQEGELVCNITTTRVLRTFFNFTPGKRYTVRAKKGGKAIAESWEAHTTADNQTYLWCPENQSTLWFVCTGTLFYCTGFDGDKNALLYQFYVGAYKIVLGYYPKMTITDSLPLNDEINPVLRYVHDLSAPFFHFLSQSYRFEFTGADNSHEPDLVSFQSQSELSFFDRTVKRREFQFEITAGQISFRTIHDNQLTEVLCVLQSF